MLMGGRLRNRVLHIDNSSHIPMLTSAIRFVVVVGGIAGWLLLTNKIVALIGICQFKDESARIPKHGIPFRCIP